jgi:hypothetical protein
MPDAACQNQPSKDHATTSGLNDCRGLGRYGPAWAILKVSIVVLLLAFTFTTFTPETSRVFGLPLLGIAVMVSLVFWPPYYQAFESWMCLLVILAWGAFGAVRFAEDLPSMHPWDHGEYFRLYVGSARP